MPARSNELQEALLRYTTETLTDVHTVTAFCKQSPKWHLKRESEVFVIEDIAERAKQKKSRANDLVSELTEVLTHALLDMLKLHPFLEAVEKLAVTSPHVFTNNPMLRLPEGVRNSYVQVIILAAKDVCRQVLKFKMDTERFFLPKLQNLDILSSQLDEYIQATREICKRFERSSFSDFGLEIIAETAVNLEEDLPEDQIQKMLDHINQLIEIRADQKFRMAFLFQQEPGKLFVDEVDRQHPKLLAFLNELEEIAVQLDRMNKGARISSVVGSSVGAAASVLSIIGLALIPVTLGTSLILTFTGMGLGIASGVNGIVTMSTEAGVNKTQKNKAQEAFESFMEDFQILYNCVNDAANQTVTRAGSDTAETAHGVGGLPMSVGGVTTVLVVNAERAASRIASDVPDIGQAAARTATAVSGAARAGLITLNALFLGVDIIFIFKDSIALAKGCETEFSQFIRARAALWRSMIDSWQKMRDSVDGGLPVLERGALLETPFY